MDKKASEKEEPELADDPLAMHRSIVKDFVDIIVRLMQAVVALEMVLTQQGMDAVLPTATDSPSEEGGESEEKEEDVSEEASPLESGETATASAHDLLVQPARESEDGVREGPIKRRRTK